MKHQASQPGRMNRNQKRKMRAAEAAIQANVIALERVTQAFTDLHNAQTKLLAGGTHVVDKPVGTPIARGKGTGGTPRSRRLVRTIVVERQDRGLVKLATRTTPMVKPLEQLASKVWPIAF
jgi:hypothetical protein